MSHSASSTPAIALCEMPPRFCRDARTMSQYSRCTWRGSWPSSSGSKSRTQPATPCGLRVSLHSPQPTSPRRSRRGRTSTGSPAGVAVDRLHALDLHVVPRARVTCPLKAAARGIPRASGARQGRWGRELCENSGAPCRSERARRPPGPRATPRRRSRGPRRCRRSRRGCTDPGGDPRHAHEHIARHQGGQHAARVGAVSAAIDRDEIRGRG